MISKLQYRYELVGKFRRPPIFIIRYHIDRKSAGYWYRYDEMANEMADLLRLGLKKPR